MQIKKYYMLAELILSDGTLIIKKLEFGNSVDVNEYEYKLKRKNPDWKVTIIYGIKK